MGVANQFDPNSFRDSSTYRDQQTTKMTIIETERLKIRFIVDEDIQVLLKIYNKPENMQYVSSGKFIWTDLELIEKYKRANKDYDRGIGIFAFELKDKKETIGEAGLFNSFSNPEKLELGYIIDSSFWKKGYGQEICKGLMDYSFGKLQIKKMVARMYADNINSVELSRKCGMKEIEDGLAENGKRFLVFEIEK